MEGAGQPHEDRRPREVGTNNAPRPPPSVEPPTIPAPPFQSATSAAMMSGSPVPHIRNFHRNPLSTYLRAPRLVKKIEKERTKAVRTILDHS